MSTTIRVSKATSAKLESEARRRGLKSKDALIHVLLGLDGDNNEASGASSANEEDDDDEAQRKTHQHEKQFFSYEDLAKEDAAMKYYTGLKPMARQWLWDMLKNLVLCLWCFS